LKNLSDIQEVQEFKNLDFFAQRVVEGFITGMHKSPYHGFSVEFAEHRLYNTGESTKHIDWKLFGRTDKLFVKRYEEETNLRAHILLDISSSMLFPYKDKKIQSKLAFSVFCAAALIYLLRKQRDAVGLSLFSDNLEFQSEAKLSLTHAKLLYNKLEELISDENVTLKKNTTVTKTLHEIAEKIHKRSLIVIFSDMLENETEENIYNALQHLRHNKHEVILFHVTDHQKEIDFNYENRPYKFIDMESGETIKLNPNNIRDVYKKSVSEYFNRLKLKCGQYKIDIIEADINKDFKNVLIPFLLKRKKLF
jgi:uncharacterized protein (DUF58 family)